MHILSHFFSTKAGLALLCCLVIGIYGCQNSDKKPQKKTTAETSYQPKLNFEQPVVFWANQQRDDTLVTLQAAIAETKSERRQGLMNVSDLPSNKGMLFIFEKEKPRSFWMANTPIPLDIIYVNSNRKIVRIHHSTQPYSKQQFKSGEPARFVIETNGGFCLNHDIHEGMYVAFPGLKDS